MFFTDIPTPVNTGNTTGSLASIILLITPFIIAGIVFLIVFASIRRKRKKSQLKK